MAVIIGLITEPIPAAAVGLVGVTGAAVLARFVLFSREHLAQLGFNFNTAEICSAFPPDAVADLRSLRVHRSYR